MGIILFLAYVPILVVVTFVTVTIGRKIYVEDDSRLLDKGHKKAIAYAAGAIFSACATVLAASYVKKGPAHDLTPVFWIGAITLIGPLLIAVALGATSEALNVRSVERRTLFALFLNRAAVGATHAVWLIPLGTLSLM
jgi:predicted neutral ceramidase superfamily lipid hydrolase